MLLKKIVFVKGRGRSRVGEPHDPHTSSPLDRERK
nr:MAG TPA: hypothetical protein [Bacteriophage sp.]